MSAKDITESLGKLLLECLRTVQIPLIIYLDSICDRFCLLILAGCFLTLPDLLRLFRRDQLRDKTLFVFLFSSPVRTPIRCFRSRAFIT